jgi:signal transduction histidine kinase
MREIRHQLNQYLRNRDRQHLDAIPSLHEATAQQLMRAKAAAQTDTEKDLIAIVGRGYSHFWDEFQRVTRPELEAGRDQAMGALIDELLTREILQPGQKYVEFNSHVVARTNEASRVTADQMRQGFLLLGVCGGAGGLIAGLAIARGITRSIVQLDVSVRGAAGKLNEVVGPVTMLRVGGLRELEAGLQEVEDHISAVVERLQQRELEVIRSEQLAAVGQLAAGIAHELRNPLMPMKMLVQAALERDDGIGLHGRQLLVVDEEISRLESSIQEFLDFARPPSLEKSRFDVQGLIEQTLDLIALRAERQGVQLRDSLSSAPMVIEADCGQIRQVILNLLLNSLDELPNGGEIKVQVIPPDPFKPGAVTPPDRAAPRTIGIRICDNGPGIPAAVLDRIFDPFISTKETGTGLGLSICQRIIVAHGGTIAAANAPDGGAEFTIQLPCPETVPCPAC